jgi:hypothetical protein
MTRFSTRDAFLILLAFCYFSSNVSYLAQVEGLYSAEGGVVKTRSNCRVVECRARTVHVVERKR